MSDTNPPDNGELHVEPGQAVGAFVPGLSDTTTTPPPPNMPPVAPNAPADRSKPKTSGLFFFLGLVSPFVLATLTTTLLSQVYWGYLVLYALVGVVFIANLLMLLIGRGKDNVALASFGKGGLWSFAVFALLSLATFGFCLVSLNNYGK